MILSIISQFLPTTDLIQKRKIYSMHKMKRLACFCRLLDKYWWKNSAFTNCWTVLGHKWLKHYFLSNCESFPLTFCNNCFCSYMVFVSFRVTWQAGIPISQSGGGKGGQRRNWAFWTETASPVLTPHMADFSCGEPELQNLKPASFEIFGFWFCRDKMCFQLYCGYILDNVDMMPSVWQ